MKGNVIKLSEEAKCMVLDEIEYKSKKYILCIEIDDEEHIVEDSIFIRQVSIVNDELVIVPLDDFEVSSIVNNIFLAKLVQEKGLK